MLEEWGLLQTTVHAAQLFSAEECSKIGFTSIYERGIKNEALKPGGGY